jgi:flavin-dependent dehydrogenase
VGRVSCRDGLVVRSAPTFVLDPVAGPGWLAVGDAASTYDPLMSQGIHKALSDGIEAAGAIAAAVGASGGSTVEIRDGYTGRVLASFEEYLANREYFYGLEERWPRSDFWQRRQAARLPRLAAAGVVLPRWRDAYGGDRDAGGAARAG